MTPADIESLRFTVQCFMVLMMVVGVSAIVFIFWSCHTINKHYDSLRKPRNAPNRKFRRRH